MDTEPFGSVSPGGSRGSEPGDSVKRPLRVMIVPGTPSNSAAITTIMRAEMWFLASVASGQHRNGGTSFARRLRFPCLLSALIAVLIVGCTEVGTDPSTLPDVSGNWNGTYAIGGSSLSASFTFAGGGANGTGTASVQSLFGGAPFDWAYDQAGRIVILFSVECEDWLGSLTPGANATTLQGSLQVERDGCAVGDNESGGLSLSR